MIVSGNSAILEDNDLCLCGSGEAFGQCCRSKKHQYKLLGTDYTGRQLIYDHTEISEAIASLTNFIESRINTQNIYSKLSKEEALRKLKRLYEKLDRALMPIQTISTCRNGCAHCCYGMAVSTSMLEFEMIQQYMKKHFSERFIEDLKAKINDKKSIYSDLICFGGVFSKEQLDDYSKLYIPCAFLDENKKCVIYEARPLMCRKYLVFNDPIDCTNRGGQDIHYHHEYLNLVETSINNLNRLYSDESIISRHVMTWFIDI